MLCGTKAATWYLGMGRRPQTAHRCTSCLKDSIILWRTKQSISVHDWAWMSREDLRNGRRVGKANPPTTWSHPGSSESVTKGRNPAQNTLRYRIQTWQTTKRLNDYTVNVWSAKLRHCLYRRFGIALYLENSGLATSVAGTVGSSHLSVHWAHVMNCTTLQLALPRSPCFCDTRANCLLYEVAQLLSDS